MAAVLPYPQPQQQVLMPSGRRLFHPRRLLFQASRMFLLTVAYNKRVLSHHDSRYFQDSVDDISPRFVVERCQEAHLLQTQLC
jgi:hypothetical protein